MLGEMTGHAMGDDVEFERPTAMPAGTTVTGITIQPQEDDSGFLIVLVTDGGPAQEAGIEVNDLLIGVEDQDVRGMTTDEVGAQAARGEEGGRNGPVVGEHAVGDEKAAHGTFLSSVLIPIVPHLFARRKKKSHFFCFFS